MVEGIVSHFLDADHPSLSLIWNLSRVILDYKCDGYCHLFCHDNHPLLMNH
jgi:hypothetical protein